MRLSRLTLSGFKSFADRTQFTFEDDVTCIVGPNGCGKSNVVDAIKWVLGERSSKSLRGKEMIDVIFAGSVGRPAAGMASVTLTFDNPILEPGQGGGRHAISGNGDGLVAGVVPAQAGQDRDGLPTIAWSGPPRRALPIDADTVDIERRLYRDGASQYLINARRVRLRDIRELFMDTGVGADAYSIIEQGKVDAMLLSNPQERRAIFEEAAGISRYKQRRAEAQRKLERTEVNLTRTREQLASTERRLRLVRGQAAKAKRFRALDGEQMALRTALAFDEYDDLRQRLDGLTSRLADLERTRAQFAERVEALERARQEAELRRRELDDEHKRTQSQRLEAGHAEQEAIQRRTMTARSLDEAKRRLAGDEDRLTQTRRRLDELDGSIGTQDETIADLTRLVEEGERDLEAATQARASVLDELRQIQSELAERRSAVGSIDRERAGLVASHDSDERRVEAVRSQLSSLVARVESLDREQDDLARSHADGQRQIEQVAGTIRGLEVELERLDESVAALSSDRREVAQRVAGLEHRLVERQSRHATLEEMVCAHVGLGEAARDVLERSGRGEGFAGVIAPLADVIEADVGDAPAVEAGLGAAARALLVGSIDELPSTEELAGLKGRVAFLPIGDGDGGADPAGLEAQTGGRARCLRGLARVRASAAPGVQSVRLERLLDRLLGRTYLVQSVESAVLLCAGPMRGAEGVRFVTREGTVVEPDGRVIAGPRSEDPDADTTGMVRRRSELDQIGAEIADLERVLGGERSALARVDDEAARLNEAAAGLGQRLARAQRELISLETALEQASHAIARLGRERSTLDAERTELRERISTLERERAALKERIGRMDRLHAEQSARAEVLERQIAHVQSRADEASESQTAAKIDLGRLGEQVSWAHRERRGLDQQREEIERQRESIAAQIERGRAEQVALAEQIEQAEGQIQSARSLGDRLEERVEALRVAREKAQTEADEAGERLAAARQRGTQIERDWHSLEVARREIEVKRENAEDRAQEELGLDLGGEYGQYRELIADGDVILPDREQATREVADLREQIRRLGNVNMDAIAEEEQLAERNESLVRQVADIDGAQRRLVELIVQLDRASRERFGHALEVIREHFAGRDGMFRRLFGGGKAEIRLMPLVKEVQTEHGVEKVQSDEVDLLESGIEIIAKPPGKQPRSLSQLSGGERTLTAVALLLAIFRSKPACFCVLDEVDSSLDDANVERYCTVIRHFTRHSHFIVITHNKRTMRQSDRLYGITMQERGVSKRVGVRLDQADEPQTDGQPVPDARSEPDRMPHPDARPAPGPLREALATMRESNSTPFVAPGEA